MENRVATKNGGRIIGASANFGNAFSGAIFEERSTVERASSRVRIRHLHPVLRAAILIACGAVRTEPRMAFGARAREEDKG